MDPFSIIFSFASSAVSTALADRANTKALADQLKQQKQAADARAALTEKYLKYGMLLAGLMVTAVIVTR